MKDNSDIIIKKFEETYLVSSKKSDAFSRFNSEELVAFELFQKQPNGEEPINRFFKQLGYSEECSVFKATTFFEKIRKDGWMNPRIPQDSNRLLQLAYFTVTLNCNLYCPYCYQGFKKRNNTNMPLEQVVLYLDRIMAVNPQCQIVVSGGEPFIHPDIFDILNIIQQKNLHFSILTNGTMIDHSTARALTEYPNLTNIQISIDGMTKEIHSITRGKSFEQTMNGILNVIEFRLPFSLAPTIHEGNCHETYEIAHFAISNNGFFTPNNLRVFPQSSNHDLKLSNEALYKIMKELNDHLIRDFGTGRLDKVKSHLESERLEKPGRFTAKHICGMAHSVVDINWDGTVYPCNLLRENCFKLGNLLNENFDSIFKKVAEKKLRFFSYEIPRCQDCTFVSTCGGGCRAGSYFTYGSLSREDNLCDILYKNQVDKLKDQSVKSK